MTKEELLEKLKVIDCKVNDYDDANEYYDAQQGHQDADEALLEFINDPEITEAFNALERWYA